MDCFDCHRLAPDPCQRHRVNCWACGEAFNRLDTVYRAGRFLCKDGCAEASDEELTSLAQEEAYRDYLDRAATGRD